MAEKKKEGREETRLERNKPVLPLRIDTDAFVVDNIGFVVDANNEFVAEYETIDEAEAFVAKANGVDVATLRRQMDEFARMRHEYLRRLRQGKKGPSATPSAFSTLSRSTGVGDQGWTQIARSV